MGSHEFKPSSNPRSKGCIVCGKTSEGHGRFVTVIEPRELEGLQALLVLHPRPWNRKLRERIDHALDGPMISHPEQIGMEL